MKEINEFEEVLFKRLCNHDYDKNILKRISKSIVDLKTKGYAIEKILFKGPQPEPWRHKAVNGPRPEPWFPSNGPSPEPWRHIIVSGRIPIELGIDPRDWFHFDEFKCFPIGVTAIEFIRFDAMIPF